MLFVRHGIDRVSYTHLDVYKRQIKISVSGTDYLLQTGEGLFINSNVLHSVYVFNDQPCLLNSLVFHKELILSLIHI